jgi:hypothetical protein
VHPGCSTVIVRYCPHGPDLEVAHVADLLRQRNSIDADLTAIISRPVTAGHLGEWIASRIFDIALEESAAAQGLDGRFRSGSLRNRTVNVKWYMKRTGLLDTTGFPGLDYYLILAGPPSPPRSSRGLFRPWCIQGVFLLDARQVWADQADRGVRQGTASSVLRETWDTAEIYPQARSTLLKATPAQVQMLRLFRP